MRSCALFLAACSAGGCGVPGSSTPARGAAPDAGVTAPAPAPAHGSARSPVVVALVVDQLSAWVAESRWPALPADGGFARLRREGTWVTTLRYPYAVTDTAPGHASLHTGRVPAESGIFGNEIPDAAGRRVTFLRDDTTRAVVPEGARANAPGSSPVRLRVDTVADRLRAARPDAFVVSVSVKDRGAIMPAGRRPTYAMWFDSSLDSFVTSTAYSQTYPRWAVGVGDTRAVVAARAKPWELDDPAWVKAHAATPDAQPGEGDLDGMGITFPHAAKTATAFRATPASDRLIVDLAIAALDAEWDPAKPTLLLMSMSASDVIGHAFGPDSWEAWDHLYKLDRQLARLFAYLDAKVGTFSAVLAADHGNLSMPEVASVRAPFCAAPDALERPCKAGVRLGPNALRDELRAAAKSAMGDGDWVGGLADPYVFLTDAARALPPDRRTRLDKVIHSTLEKHRDGIDKIFDVRELATACPRVLATARGKPERAERGEDLVVLVCRSWTAGIGAGDYYLVPKVGSYFDGEVVVGKGTSHGSPYLYDRTVPMLVRSPGVVPAGVVLTDPVDFGAYSALEAAFIGLDTAAPSDILEAHRAKKKEVSKQP